MKNKFCKLSSYIFGGLLFSMVAKADDYQIRYLNSKNIKINFKPAVLYMRFSDKDRIVWPQNEKDIYMRLWNMTQHKEEYRPPRKKKRSTGTDEKDLSTKGFVSDSSNVDLASKIFPMLDSLNFVLTTTDYDAIKFEARWIDENYEEKKVILPRSKDGSSICLTREMLGFPEGKIGEIEIYVFKPDDEEGYLWKDIIVEVVPLIKME